jgi:hypothetical protein
MSSRAEDPERDYTKAKLSLDTPDRHGNAQVRDRLAILQSRLPECITSNLPDATFHPRGLSAFKLAFC